MIQSPHKGAYETQSGAIQGILADMMDSFTRDYASNDEEETAKQKDFDALIKTKTEDLKALEKALTDKTMSEGDGEAEGFRCADQDEDGGSQSTREGAHGQDHERGRRREAVGDGPEGARGDG